jgi:spermidine synthase
MLPFSLGFSSMATQLILLREFLSVFNGNELSIGIILANWMLLTGAGAFIGRKSRYPAALKGIVAGLFVMAFIPAITLLLLCGLRNVVWPVGSLTGIGKILLGSSMLLAPFCLLSGWLFVRISRYLSDPFGKSAVSLAYGWETLGSIMAGLLCSMILVFLFAPFQNLAIVFLLNGSILFTIYYKRILWFRKQFYLYLSAAFLIALALIIASLDNTALQFLFPGQKVVSFKDTPYGKLVVTEKAGQLNFYENNSLLFTTNNIIASEETAHYALLQRKIHGNVLLLGGSISGVARECLKYPLHRLDCIEINPRVIALGKRFRRLPSDSRLTVFTGDPRLMLRDIPNIRTARLFQTSQGRNRIGTMYYDAILLDLPEPSTLRINRFYTLEFLKVLKALTVKNGIVALSLMPTMDYVGSDALKIQSTMYQTLKSVFRNVLVISGEKNYFLASDSALTTAVSTLGAKRGIENEYVNGYFLDDASMKERSDYIMKRINVNAPLNLDFEPVGCYRQLHYWLSLSGNGSIYLIVSPLVLLLVLAGIRSGGITVAMFSAGLSSFSLEIILMLIFQVIYGYVYLMAGIFITVFMSGLVAGVFLAKKTFLPISYKLLILLQILSVCIILASCACVFLFMHFRFSTSIMFVIFNLLIFGMAAVSGTQFHAASVLKSGTVQQAASANYSADLLGSATGALLINAWLLPLWGFMPSLLVVVGANTMAIIFMLVKKRNFA